MTRPITTDDLSNLFDTDLIWRRKELSDIKAAIRRADEVSRSALLRALVTMSYAHWEGYVRFCSRRYFEHITLRKLPFSSFQRQFYVNSFLPRLDSLYRSRADSHLKSRLINEVLDGRDARFSYINEALIDTKSNLGSDVVKEICLICGVDDAVFEEKKIFIDIVLLRRRNAIAHGQYEVVAFDEIDNLVNESLALMQHFRTLLENNIYSRAYLVA